MALAAAAAAAAAALLRVELLRLRNELGERASGVEAMAMRTGADAKLVVLRLCLASWRASERAAATRGMATMMVADVLVLMRRRLSPSAISDKAWTWVGEGALDLRVCAMRNQKMVDRLISSLCLKATPRDLARNTSVHGLGEHQL